MYRIISLTDTISKVYERVILGRITPIVNQYLSDHQHGFRKGRNTEGAGLILAAATGMGNRPETGAPRGSLNGEQWSLSGPPPSLKKI